MKITTTPSNPVVLITGAALRIGRHIALIMADRGWDVAVHYNHSEPAALLLASEITAMGRRAMTLQCDLADEVAVKKIVPQVLAGLGSLQCVVNNASIFEADTAQDFSHQRLERHMRINLSAPVLLAHSLYESTPDGALAAVINILDQKLFNLNPDFLSYTLSKAALQCATTTLAQALAPKVRVVGIAPGITLASTYQDQHNFEHSHQVAALGRSSSPQDIADAVYFLATAHAITGTILAVDGGQHLIPSTRDVMYAVPTK